MKRWQVIIEIEDLKAWIYIEAKTVLKTSHDTVVADGVKIQTPGEIITVEPLP